MAEKSTKVSTKMVDFQDPFAGAIPADISLEPPKPFLSTPAAYGPEKVSIPPALQPAGASAPDPFAGASPATIVPEGEAEPADPFAGAIKPVGAHTSEDIKGVDTAALVADKDFHPVEWLAANEQQALADPALLQKVQDVYEQRYKNQKGAVRSFVENLAPSKLVPATVGVAKGLASAVSEPFAVLGRAAGKASTGDIKGAAGEVAAAPQAVAEAGTRDVNLAYRTARGLAESGAVLPPQISIPLQVAFKGGPSTPQDFRSRLFFDVELQKQEEAARAGNSDLAKFLGTDTESLAKAGVVVNPESVEKLSVVADPVNFIPIGAAVGAVSKGGKFVVASLASAEAADKLAKALNTAVRVPGAAAATLTEALGKLAVPAGEGLAKGAKAVRTAPLGGSLGLAVKGTALGAEGAGKVLSVAGKVTKAAAPVVGNIVTEGLKGGLEAGAVTFPLTIGASDEEREALMGNIGLAAALRPGLGLAAQGAQAAGNATRNAVAARIYKSVERAATPKSASYGTDPRLDLAHEQQMANTPSATQNVVNYFREFFRPAGIEIYTLDGPSFVKNVDQVGGAEKAKGFFVKRGERINADGTQTQVNQIFLNGGADAIGHELYHAFEGLDPEGAKNLKSEISKSWTPDEQKQWKQTYESALNGGLPEEQWTRRLSDDDLLSEAAAEIFGRVLEATDLTGTKDGVQNRAAHLLANGLEKVGFPLGGPQVAKGPGVSELGIRPTKRQFDVAQSFLRDIAARTRENGSVIGAAREPVTLKELQPGEISRRQEPPSTPPAAPPVAPVPTPPPPAPAAPAAAQATRPPISVTGLTEPPAAPATIPENIPGTASQPADFAAKRSAVTNAADAATAAANLGPEVQKVVQDVNAAIDQGQTAFEVEHHGVKSEGGREVTRTPRRTEQEEAYVRESEGALPSDVREQHQKVSSFVRWDVTKDGTPQFIGYSLDKALANIEHLVRWSKERGVEIPYDGTPESFRQAAEDLKDYYNNQAHGYRGDGEVFVRPTEDIQVSIPPEDPNYTPVKLSPEKTQFLNAAQGTQLAVPLTVREQRGKIPGNIKAQLLNELQGGKPITTADVKKFKTKVGGREFAIAEVNPLRAEMQKAGVPVRQLIEVTERLNADDILSARPRADIDVKPGVTDITRSGFLPSAEEAKQIRSRLIVRNPDGSIPLTGSPEMLSKIAAVISPDDVKEVDKVVVRKYEGDNLKPIAELRRKPWLPDGAFVDQIKRTLTGDVPESNRGLQVTDFSDTGSKFLPSGDDIKAETERRMEEKIKLGYPDSEQTRKKVAQEIDFDLRRGKPLRKEIGEGASFFLPSNPDDVVRHAIDVMNMTTPQFSEFTKSDPGGLTGAAFKLGLGLEDRSSLDVLKRSEQEARERMMVAKNARNLDDMFSYSTRRQYFKEALEAATGTGGSKDMLTKMLGEAYKPPFPETAAEPAGKFAPSPAPNEEVRDVAREYAKGAGIDYRPKQDYVPVNEDLAKRIADTYEAAKNQPDDPQVRAAYDALAKETVDQYNVIKGAGYEIEPYLGKGEPYKNSNELIADVRDNKHLYYLRTEEAYGAGQSTEGNLMLRPSGVKINGQELPVNDVFRAVHDFYGHAKEGVAFGPKGEYNAWRSHAELYSPEAVRAMTSELLGQNSWTNAGKHLRDASGNIPAKGEPGYKPLTERPFAEQKNFLMPDNLIEEAKAGSDTASEAAPAKPSGQYLPSKSPEFEEELRKVRDNENFGQTFNVDGTVADIAGQPINIVTVASADVPADGLTPNSVRRAMKPYEGVIKAVPESKIGVFRIERKGAAGEDQVSIDLNVAVPKEHFDNTLAFARANNQESFWDAEKSEVVPSGGTGETVLKSPEEIQKAMQSLVKGEPVDFPSGQFAPSVPSDETVKDALSEDKKPFVGAHRDLPEGTPVGLRIDIPAFTRKGAYVVTVHEKAAGGRVGKRLGYDSIATVDNPTFFSNEAGAEKIRGGAAKFPIATVEGEFNHAREVPSGPEWTEVGFNPTKHSYFYDKETDNPVVGGEQAVSVGNSVFVKNAEFGDKANFRFLPAKAKKNVEENVTGWILPNAEFKDLGDTGLHERFLAKNAEDLNKRFGTSFNKATGEEHRIDAINKGFVRIRSDDNGNTSIEASANKWTPSIKRAVANHLRDNLDNLSKVKLQLLDSTGKPVDSHTIDFFSADIPEEAPQELVDAVRTSGLNQFGAAFLPSADEVEAARDAALTKIQTVKRENPEAIIPEYQKDDEGKIIINDKGKAKEIQRPYGFEESPGAKEAMKGKKGDKVRFDAATDAASDKLVEFYNRVKDNPLIKVGEEWYSKARTLIKDVFGDQSELFAQLLAATSAHTDVETNYKYAIEAINNLNEGKYDRNIAKYQEGLENFAKGNVEDMIQETGKEDPNRAQYMEWWIDKHDLSPVRNNKKLFGANSRHVLRVLAGHWTGSQKTQQFFGNLSGKSFEATIDVWAARAVHRALNEEFGGRWRILPKFEKAPTPKEFEFAQVAFRKAAKEIGIQPDALQAILWFGEKDYWAGKGWTKNAGAEKSDFNVSLAKTKKEGPVYVVKKLPEPQSELRFDVNKKEPEAEPEIDSEDIEPE